MCSICRFLCFVLQSRAFTLSFLTCSLSHRCASSYEVSDSCCIVFCPCFVVTLIILCFSRAEFWTEKQGNSRVWCSHQAVPASCCRPSHVKRTEMWSTRAQAVIYEQLFFIWLLKRLKIYSCARKYTTFMHPNISGEINDTFFMALMMLRHLLVNFIRLLNLSAHSFWFWSGDLVNKWR